MTTDYPTRPLEVKGKHKMLFFKEGSAKIAVFSFRCLLVCSAFACGLLEVEVLELQILLKGKEVLGAVVTFKAAHLSRIATHRTKHVQ